MRRSLVAALTLSLAGCSVTGELYGGGDGLAVTMSDGDGDERTYAWAAARKGQLRQANKQELLDAVAFAVLPEDTGRMGVRVDSDVISAPDLLAALGGQCDEIAESYTVIAVGGDVSIAFSFFGQDNGHLQYRVDGADGAPTELEGSTRGPVELVTSNVTCADQEDAELSAAWSFDEDVRVRTRCVGCDLYDLSMDLSF